MTDRGFVQDVVRVVIGSARRVGRRGQPETGAGVDASGRSSSGSTFIRGLSIGMLVGGAIAGSTIWERRHRRRRPPPSTGTPAQADDREAARGRDGS